VVDGQFDQVAHWLVLLAVLNLPEAQAAHVWLVDVVPATETN
jgi:hypothetical protein